MTRRNRGGRGGGETAGGIEPVYEGPEVLGALLARAGSPHGAEEVTAIFARAQKAGEPRASVIPALFADEPHFESPDAARRLYGNLFGLWGRLAAGLGPHDDAPEVVPEPAELPPLPERGAVEDVILPAELVEAVWKHLAAAAPREVQRRKDRFMNVQPDLVAWLDTVPLPETGGLAATDLVFEAWVMFDQGHGERLEAVTYRDLREAEEEPPPLESTQPALAAYVAEQLDLVLDEDPAFDAAARAQVERAVAAAVAALTAAVREWS
jgi:hypothetical protein